MIESNVLVEGEWERIKKKEGEIPAQGRFFPLCTFNRAYLAQNKVGAI